MHGSQLMPSDNIHPLQIGTVQDINQANQQFWTEQQILMDSRTSDELLVELALADLNSEYDRGVPIRARKTFEKAFDDVEKVRRLLHVKFSQKGGKKRKRDVLQEMIDGFVSENPNISEKDLLSRLKEENGEGTIESIGSEAACIAGDYPLICYVDDKGNQKTAPVHGLKDRLSRAKKKINSR